MTGGGKARWEEEGKYTRRRAQIEGEKEKQREEEGDKRREEKITGRKS